jgi:hypothetical protein
MRLTTGSRPGNCTGPKELWTKALLGCLALFVVLCSAHTVWGQIDQGSITGITQDNSGAIIPHASVTLKSIDTGLTVATTGSAEGVFMFSPLKIGDYTVTASAPGFSNLTQEKIHVDAQAKVNVSLVLQVGGVSESVTVTTAPPMLQTESGSVGQVLDTRTINEMPLNGRNAMYVAQLAAGVVRGGDGRGAGEGDFDANGQRAQQNNFVLDGVDNNSYLPAFTNQPGFVLNPPPDALSEFTVQTSNYAAEIGHSAGAVMNTSIKTGTNSTHGSLWEYVRNTAFDARDWNASSVPAYHENQFGATLGGPVLRNKLFFFGYAEDNRISFAQPSGPLTVPTALMRTGDFSELLNPALTSSGTPIKLYQPNLAGAPPLTCNGKQNVICPANSDPISLKIVKLFPAPNIPNGLTYNNYQTTASATANTWQWGARLDYNMNTKDQMFTRYSYANFHLGPPAILGYPLDGGSVNNENSSNVNNNLAASETHAFTSKILNEARFGWTNGDETTRPAAYNHPELASSLDLGGIPSGGIIGGSLPTIKITGTQQVGTGPNEPQFKAQNNYDVLDNFIWIHGNHAFKAGLELEWIHLPFFSPQSAYGAYTYTGTYTSSPGVSQTGYGLADFLLNQMNKASISNYTNLQFSRYARSAYFQDDWKVTPHVTLNLGVRYDNFQPNVEDNGQFGNMDVIPNGPSQGTGVLIYPSSQRNAYLAPRFLQYLSDNRISLQYSDNTALIRHQNFNYSPRFGFSFSPDGKWVLRGGFGIFYSKPENTGGPETMQNYPFQNSSTFSAGGCKAGSCVPIGINLENGFSSLLSGNGLVANVTSPTFNGSQQFMKTPYTESYNLNVQRAITGNIVATAGYVGNVSRHLIVNFDRNSPMALIDPRLSNTTVEPFYNPAGGNASSLGTILENEYIGVSSYNSLQTKLEKRFSGGLEFLATYTWAHSLDDASQPLSGISYRAQNIIGIEPDYTRSDFDVHHRITFNGFYQIPVGRGRRFHPGGGVGDIVLGDWSTDLQWTAQSGLPFTVNTNLGSAGPNGGNANAVGVSDPFASGGSVPAGNTSLKSCPSSVRNRNNWYNPCAFGNPPLAFPQAGIAGSQVSNVQITGLAALPYLGGRPNEVDAPGSERLNMSIFKSFPVLREQHFDFRVDIFNVLNHPSWGAPSNTSNNITGGQITTPQTFQLYTPDSRFFQFSGKYVF